MNKKIFALVLCFFLMVPMVAIAENEPPASLEAPRNLNAVESEHPGVLNLRLTNPESIAQLINNDYEIFYEVDWKIDDGLWKFNKDWGDFTPEGLYDYYGDKDGIFGSVANINRDEDDALTIAVPNNSLGIESFDLKNNTYYFRLRYIYEYESQDTDTGNGGYRHVVSPWTEASIGKHGTSGLPDSLSAPINLKAELKKHTDGKPYYQFTWEIPDDALAANQLTKVICWVDWKIGDGAWVSESEKPVFSNNTLSTSM